MLCSVIKHARKLREHSGSREKHSPAARVHLTLLLCSRHFLACLITEQSTVLALLFVFFTRIQGYLITFYKERIDEGDSGLFRWGLDEEGT